LQEVAKRSIDRERLAWAATKHEPLLDSDPLTCICGWRDDQAPPEWTWIRNLTRAARRRWREHLIAGMADAYEGRTTFYATVPHG
jgi:hypothetical protein